MPIFVIHQNAVPILGQNRQKKIQFEKNYTNKEAMKKLDQMKNAIRLCSTEELKNAFFPKIAFQVRSIRNKQS